LAISVAASVSCSAGALLAIRPVSLSLTLLKAAISLALSPAFCAASIRAFSLSPRGASLFTVCVIGAGASVAGNLCKFWLTRPATARRANPATAPKRMTVTLLLRFGGGLAALGGATGATGADAIFAAGFGADTGAEGRTAIRVVSSGGRADSPMAIR